MTGPGFAIIDFETTGLFHGRNDRIIEIAVVHADRFGNVTGKWETLVNPGRDLGRHDIHRIRAADILAAPTFEQIAPRLVELLSGRVLVAHNARFDTGFLLAELDRISYWLGLEIPKLCTMQLAKELLPGSGRALRDCCDAYGIELLDAHRASADALATAHLLAAYIASTPETEYWNDLVDGAEDLGWPPLALVEAAWIAREAAAVDPTTFLERITLKLPDDSGPSEHTEYLALLDRCLIDQQLSVHEANALVQLAEEYGISRASCEQLHRRYFDDLTAIAWADGVLTVDEISTLVAVGKLLRITAETIAGAMQRPTDAAEPAVSDYARAFSLAPGDLVVLTGEMARSRDEWQAELVGLGFVPWAAVTKKVKLVVAADPDSLSGKARKARDYGIAIVDERGLAALLAR